MDDLLDGSYVEAAKGFDEVERQHPYSVWATRAQIMAAYAYYKNNNYDESILSAARFIQLHPGHRDAAYAYYLKAVSYYERISDVGRDQEMTEQALASLEELVRQIAQAVDSRARLVRLPPWVALLGSKLLGLLVRDVLLTKDEVDGLLSNLLVTAGPETAPKKLSDWLGENAGQVGSRYASELSRHY